MLGLYWVYIGFGLGLYNVIGSFSGQGALIDKESKDV